MYEFSKGPDGLEFLIVNSSIEVEKVREYIEANSVENLYFNQRLGYEKKAISDFTNIDCVLRIHVVISTPDLSGLEAMERLEWLYLMDPILDNFDFSMLKNLKSLNFSWSEHVLGLEKLEHMECLSIRNFSGDPKLFQSFSKLQTLKLISGSTANLDFLSGLQIKELELALLKKLHDIKGLSLISDTLEKLRFDSCNKIDYSDTLLLLKRLKKLMMANSGSIESLNFVKNLSKLEFISFVGTDILDCDLSPCVGIDFVGFQDKKKKYNYEKKKGVLVKRET